MKRIQLVLVVAAVMVAMLAALPGPAMARDNDRAENRVENRIDHFENRIDRFEDRHDFDDDAAFFSPFYYSSFYYPYYAVNGDLADELCSPLNPDAVNNLVPGCVF